MHPVPFRTQLAYTKQPPFLLLPVFVTTAQKAGCRYSVSYFAIFSFMFVVSFVASL